MCVRTHAVGGNFKIVFIVSLSDKKKKAYGVAFSDKRNIKAYVQPGHS